MTEAGCASKATRRPRSGARKSASAISRSMPNFMVATLKKFHTQSNRNDGSPAGRADAPTPNRIDGRLFLRSPPRGRDAMLHHAAAAINPARLARCSAPGAACTSIRGASISVATRMPAAIAIEPIRRPLRRGRKVEFVIGLARQRTHEGLEASVPPKLIGPRSRRDRRQAQIADFAGHDIREQQTAGAGTRNLHFDVCRGETERVRMKS